MISADADTNLFAQSEKSSVSGRRSVFARLELFLGEVCLILMFSAATMASLEDSAYLKWRNLIIVLAWVGLGVLIIWRVPISTLLKLPVSSVGPLITWTVFSMTLTCVAIGHQQVPVDELWFLVGVPVLFFIGIPKLLGSRAAHTVGKALVVGNLPYILLSLVQEPVVLGRSYSGLFRNPNAMGAISLAIAIGAMAVLTSMHTNKMGPRRRFYLAILVLAVICILLSASRTSLVSVFVVIGAYVLTDGRKHGRSFRRRLSGLVTISILVTPLLFNDSLAKVIVSGITNKMQIKVASGSLLSNRDYIWRTTLNEAALFGHGPDYFMGNFGINAHNSVIEILGTHGVLASVLLVIFGVWVGWRALRCRNDENARGSMIIILGFWLLSMAETMLSSLSTGITMAFLIACGVVLTSRPAPSSRTSSLELT